MAQRNLGTATSTLQSTLERLSSGQRITRASDDAAGLSVSSVLSANAHIFTTGVRNLNDGISLYNVADGALQTVKTTIERMRELASQSANGTLTNVQRKALDKEYQSLASEYNRIIDSTQFNGLSVFSDRNLSVLFEAGGSQMALALSAQTQIGTATFTASATCYGVSSAADANSADYNRDGNIDLAILDTGGMVNLFYGNGDGTFRARSSIATNIGGGDTSSDLVTSDLNGDGLADLIVNGKTTNLVTIHLNNGNGTFAVKQAFAAAGAGSFAFDVGDLNDDGKLDLFLPEAGVSNPGVYLGNGDGTFQARTAGPGILAGALGQAILADANNDGNLDALVHGGGSSLLLCLGNGDGTFGGYGGPLVIGLDGSGGSGGGFKFGDFNSDGNADVISYNGTDSALKLWLGNGNGTFRAPLTASVPGAYSEFAVGDLNGDGKLDFVGGNIADYVNIFTGNGDGTFTVGSSVSVRYPTGIEVNDFNNDGALDLAVPGHLWNSRVLLNGTTTASTSLSMRRLGVLGISQTSVKTLYDARIAQDRLTSYANFASTLSGALGAAQSRLGYAVSTLDTARVESEQAASRITDADMATETATLVRSQIVQKAATAVLAQANQQPALALQLLSRR